MAHRVIKSAIKFDRLVVKTSARLLKVINVARAAKGWSLADLAHKSGVSLRSIADLGAGSGSVQTMIAAMNALNIELSQIGNGSLLGVQLTDCREAQGLSVEQVAAGTRLSRGTVAELEQGTGKVGDLVRLLAYIAPKVRCRKAKLGFAGTAKSGDGDRRFSPPSFMISINLAYGRISTDPCADRMSGVVADRQIHFAEGGNGLTEDWSGRLAFVNPPFSDQLTWVERAYQQWRSGKVKTVICLVPVKTCNLFFKTLFRTADIYVLEGRLRFADPRGKSEPTKYSLMVVAFGATARQKARFAQLEPGIWLNAGLATAVWSILFKAVAVASQGLSRMRGLGVSGALKCRPQTSNTEPPEPASCGS